MYACELDHRLIRDATYRAFAGIGWRGFGQSIPRARVSDWAIVFLWLRFVTSDNRQEQQSRSPHQLNVVYTSCLIESQPAPLNEITRVASGLLMLLDDITSILDDVAVLTKVAAKNTAGVLGDDLALNAQQVTGVDPSRELPVVWAVAKGSMVNKSILVPVALGLGAAAPWAITPLLIAGGMYLCYEGCEKLAHKFLPSSPDEEAHEQALQSALTDPAVDMAALEKEKIKGAIRTDFILSAEIIVIALGTLEASTFLTRVLVLVAVAILMTIGVYGIVAGIVKLDDLGARLIRGQRVSDSLSFKQSIGHAILAGAPYLMKSLSIGGTIAMFLVGGGILVHRVPPIDHAIEDLLEPLAGIASIGGFLHSASGIVLDGLIGLAGGTVVLIIVLMAKRIYMR